MGGVEQGSQAAALFLMRGGWKTYPTWKSVRLASTPGAGG
jgi:hypothetical protein